MAPPGIGGLMVRSGAALLSSARSLELEVLRQSVWFLGERGGKVGSATASPVLFPRSS